MSDSPLGPGWWEASDGKWYAPEQHPDYRPRSPRLGPPVGRTDTDGSARIVGATGYVESEPRKSKRRKIFALLLALLAIIVAVAVIEGRRSSKRATPVSVNLVKNGDFEVPKGSPETFRLFSAGESLDGWKVVGIGNVAVNGGAYVSEGLDFPAQHGRQWLDLTGLTNSAAGVSQPIATVAGRNYTLRFAVGNQDDPHGIYGTRSTVDVYVNGKRLMIATNSIDNGSSTQVWKFFTRQFIATRTSTTIRFMNGDVRTDNTNGLDSVSVH